MFFFGKSSQPDSDDNDSNVTSGEGNDDNESDVSGLVTNGSGVKGVHILFPSLLALLDMTPKEAVAEMKANKVVDDTLTLSELVDAFWWCMYGFLYTTQTERVAPYSTHDEYFYGKDGFRADAFDALVIESFRLSAKTHRYPYPKKASKSKKSSWVRGLNSYHELITKSIMSMECGGEVFSSPEVVKMTIDMLRSEQERLLGSSPESVSETRKAQFRKIALMLDGIFSHRSFVERCIDQECEVLTPEEAVEWDTVKSDLGRFSEDEDLPGFIRKLIHMQDVMIQPL